MCRWRTALNWNQTGPQGPSSDGDIKAYGRVTYDSVTHAPILDLSHSSGVASIEPGIDYVEGVGTQNVCIKLSPTVSSSFNGIVASSTAGGEFGPYGTSTSLDNDLSGTCVNGADAMTSIGGAPSLNTFYFTVY